MFNRYLKAFYGEKAKKPNNPKNPGFFMLGFFVFVLGWVFWVGFLLPTLLDDDIIIMGFSVCVTLCRLYLYKHN